MKFQFYSYVAVIVSSLLLSSCGVVEVDNGCIQIKKLSVEKRQIGSALLGSGDAGSSNLTEAQRAGYEYIVEGTQLVIDNPQCFTGEEVSFAKKLLGQ